MCAHSCRKNVPLKKVNSKYILKSTLTPRLARKQFQKNTTGLERSRSWSSLDNANGGESDFTSQNYLTVHVSIAIDDDFVDADIVSRALTRMYQLVLILFGD